MLYMSSGRGFAGLVFPGCPAKGVGCREQSKSQQNLKDSYQVNRTSIGDDATSSPAVGFSTRDIVAVPAGSCLWMYNDGDTTVAIQIFVASNSKNQLKPTLRVNSISHTKQGHTILTFSCCYMD